MDAKRLAELGARARRLMTSGRLPRAPDRAFAGYNHGQTPTCALCAQQIYDGAVVYEVDTGTVTAGESKLHFHVDCHFAWEYESNRQSETRSSG